MKKFTVILLVIFAVFAIFRFISGAHQQSQMTNQPVLPTETNATPLVQATPSPAEFKAAFAIYTNSANRVFTDPKYHNRSQDIYLKESNPNIIIVKKAGVTWDVFFKSLPSPMKVTSECLITGLGETFCTGNSGTLSFYINGQEDPEALAKPVNPGDKLLVTFGNKSATQIQSQIDQIPKP